jgi:hypothetical protein
VERWRGETLRMGLLYEQAAVEFWTGAVARARSEAEAEAPQTLGAPSP